MTKIYTLDIVMLVASDCREDSFNRTGQHKTLITVTEIMNVGGKEVDIIGINFV